MNRRHFLSLLSFSAVSGVSGVLPALACARGRGDDSPEAIARVGLERARKAGKPLLVLVIPSEPGAASERGEWFGSWLALADAALLADLALFERICVPMAALADLGVRDVDPKTEPVMLFIETHEDAPHAIAIDGALDEELVRAFANPWLQEGESYEAAELRMGTAIRARNAALTGWLRDTVKLDERMPRLAAQVDATLTDDERAQIAKHLAQPAAIDRTLLERAGAVVRDAIPVAETKQQEAAIRAIAAVTADAIRTKPPAGAVWARSSGCGFEFEDPNRHGDSDDAGIECGMGFVPEEGKRFLFFLQGADRGR
ncbi:MAG: hypothetical protein IT459_06770 [Planctomycetes bacterium]|nr:hypothetical protein [Planctomycetota bacterium]